MRYQLVGYLLGGLEDNEARELEAALSDAEQGDSLRRDLQLLRRAVRPLEWDRTAVPPQAGLASRTLAFVSAQTRPETIPLRTMSPAREGTVPTGRGWLDRVLLAASALAACILVAPLIYEAIMDNRARRSERKLQRL